MDQKAHSMTRWISSPSFAGSNSLKNDEAIISAVSVCLVRSGINIAQFFHLSPLLETLARNAVAPPNERPSLSNPFTLSGRAPPAPNFFEASKITKLPVAL